MSKKQILFFGFSTIIFFLIFVHSWSEDYYFPILLFIFYFFSEFIKSGIVKYYTVICILSILVLIQDSWLIDHAIPILLMIIILGDVLFQLINIIQAKVFKKFEYKLIKLLIPTFPVLVVIILINIETKNLYIIKSNLPLYISTLLNKCETTNMCSKDVWEREIITEGITTVQISYLYENNCLLVYQSSNRLNFSSYNSCEN